MNKYTFKGTYYGKTVVFIKYALSLREAWQQIDYDRDFDVDNVIGDLEDIRLVQATTVTYSGVIPELGWTYCTMEDREEVEELMKEFYETSSLKFHYIIVKKTPRKKRERRMR